MYEKSRGKSYRHMKVTSASSSSNSINNENRNQGETTSFVESCSVHSSSSDSSEPDEKQINSELIEFINRKKSFILDLVYNPSFSSEFHTRSDRLMALKRCSSLKKFESNAIKESSLIRSQLKEDIGCGLDTFEPYSLHIFSAVLQERKIPNPEDILDHDGF